MVDCGPLARDFKQSQYGRIILPFTLLRRLEAVLAESKPAVLAEFERLASMRLPEDAQEKFLLRATGGLAFFNTSTMDLSTLGELLSDPRKAAAFAKLIFDMLKMAG